MSSDEQDVDIESDEEETPSSSRLETEGHSDKRAHHNALERKRRDHIKGSFNGLKDSIPSMQVRVVFSWVGLPGARFLVADTRLYTLPCRSVGPSIRHIPEL